jgi:hypothetical protein
VKLESSDPVADKQRWKLVRTDNYTDVPGEILYANETTGDCCMTQADGKGGTENKNLSFGPGGIRIVGRQR